MNTIKNRAMNIVSSIPALACAAVLPELSHVLCASQTDVWGHRGEEEDELRPSLGGGGRGEGGGGRGEGEGGGGRGRGGGFTKEHCH